MLGIETHRIRRQQIDGEIRRELRNVLAVESRAAPVISCLVVCMIMLTLAAPTDSRHWKPNSPVYGNVVACVIARRKPTRLDRVNGRSAAIRRPRTTRMAPQTKRGSPGLVNPWRSASVNAIGKRPSLAELAGAPREAAAAAAAGAADPHAAAHAASADHGASAAASSGASAHGASSAASASAASGRGTSSAAASARAAAAAAPPPPHRRRRRTFGRTAGRAGMKRWLRGRRRRIWTG